MIVGCEQCRAQFRLDDSKVPESGARVRCSRCNHAFFIEPPDLGDERQAEELARDAVESLVRRDADEGESDWQFNHDATEPEMAGPAAASGLQAAREAVDDLLGELARSAPARPETPEAAPEPAEAMSEPSEAAPEDGADPSSEAALGSPEAWNFFEDAEDDSGTEVGRLPLVPRWELLEQEREEAEREIEARAATAAELDEREGTGLGRLLRVVGTGLGWMLTAALLGAGAWAAVTAQPPTLAAESAELWGAGFRAVEVRGRWIENAVSGPLYVVAGRLRRDEVAGSASAGSLVLRLLDAGGEPVAAEPTPVGPPFPQRALRERAPAELRASQERAAIPFAQLHRGESVAFQALFAGVPPDAARFDLERMERAP